MDKFTSILPVLQTILALSNIAVMLWALKTFLNKPHDDLEQRVKSLEVKVDEMEDSLKQGNDRFREQEKTNATFKSVMLSFVNFEIAYCIHTGYEHQEDLIKAKSELENYLSGK